MVVGGSGGSNVYIVLRAITPPSSVLSHSEECERMNEDKKVVARMIY